MTETRKITYAMAINEALTEEMAHNPAVILLGANASSGGDYGITKNIVGRFRKNRVIDIPTGESTALGFALGLAMTGVKPVLEINGMYIFRALDTLINEVAKTESMYAAQFNSSMVIRVSVGYSAFNGVQSNVCAEAALCSIPNVTVAYPSTAAEAKGMLKAAIRSEGISVILENINYYNKTFTVPKEEYLVNLNKPEIKLNGKDISIITYGPATKTAYEAIKKASSDGISCELIDLRTISPINPEVVIESVSKTGRALIIHNSPEQNGVGSRIAAIISQSEAFDYLESPVVRICGQNNFVGYTKEALSEALPDSESIYRAIRDLTDAEEIDG